MVSLVGLDRVVKILSRGNAYENISRPSAFENTCKPGAIENIIIKIVNNKKSRIRETLTLSPRVRIIALCQKTKQNIWVQFGTLPSF